MLREILVNPQSALQAGNDDQDPREGRDKRFDLKSFARCADSLKAEEDHRKLKQSQVLQGIVICDRKIQRGERNKKKKGKVFGRP